VTAQSTSANELKIALFGAGQHARHHARAILRCPGTRIVAVADPSPAARSMMQEMAPDMAGFDSPEELLQQLQADVIHICTPPASHASLAMLALNAGCNIYVEKPFTESSDEASRVLGLAATRGLSVCAGHQLLFEPPTRLLERYIGSVGRVAHVESYFSFRPAQHAPGGRKVLRADDQLLDILPHPVYLLLRMLDPSAANDVEVTGLELSRGGTVHALVRCGGVTGTLVVTLEGRPVESYLRVVGTNGSLTADYVRGTMRRDLGPGASGIDKLFAPYRHAWQLLTLSTAAFGRRFLKRQMSYPGLAELFEAFYDSIRSATESPLPPESLLETVRICEKVGIALRAAEAVELAAAQPRPMEGRGVLVTGGTGLLGKAITKALLDRGRPVRVLARREPPSWARVPGVEFLVADLAEGIDPECFDGIDTVIHAAAETAGGWDEHQRNSLDATEAMLRASAASGITRFLHVSSLGILDKGGPSPVRDDHPLEPNSTGSGPYVWGKLESERLAVKLGTELGVDVKVVRPGALVDYADFDPPGQLGKRLGNFFVAVGSPGKQLGVAEVAQSGQILAWMSDHWTESPKVLNMIDPALPTNRALLGRLRAANPDLTVVWLPTIALIPLSWLAIVLQKVLRPGKPAINAAKVFAADKYDPSTVAALWQSVESEQRQPQGRRPLMTAGATEAGH
jgi:predicted dehydrogenase/nucleoside-diphosphate-sugar epimerase